MKTIRWSQEKNKQLQRERGLTFEIVLTAIERGDVLDDLVHSNLAKYPNQRMMVVRIGNYAFLVPYVDSSSELFLKTIIPSRKATQKYLGGAHTAMTQLNQEEQEILDSYDNDEWNSLKTPGRMAQLKSYAKATLAKDKKITLRLSSLDLEALQAKAIEEGIPYQTLISSILHKYVTGRLIDN